MPEGAVLGMSIRRNMTTIVNLDMDVFLFLLIGR
jgi:hypothetical protein